MTGCSFSGKEEVGLPEVALSPGFYPGGGSSCGFEEVIELLKKLKAYRKQYNILHFIFYHDGKKNSVQTGNILI